MAILDAIVDGERDPLKLAQLKDPRVRSSVETIAKALTGDYRPDQLFVLKQARESYRFLQAQIAECDVEVETVLSAWEAKVDIEQQPLAAPTEGVVVCAARQGNCRRNDATRKGNALPRWVCTMIGGNRTMNRRAALSSLALVGTRSSAAFAQVVSGGDAARHGFVFQQKGRFGGWPANGGIWSWGNEIVVGFSMGYHQEKRDEHSVDRTKQSIFALGRSKDSGETWTVEEHDELNNSQGVPCPGGIDFGHPNFAIRCRKNWFHVSDNRGKTWQGPYQLPDFGMGLELTARTDFLVQGKQECLLFLSAKDNTVQAGIQDRAFCGRTSDGGKTFQFVSWMTGEPRSVRSVMPSTVRVSSMQLVSALRRRVDPARQPRCDINWIDAYSSNDSGRTWVFLSRVAYTDLVLHNGNPPSLVRLKDGRLCVTYGFRGVPFGIRAKISKDNGMTWGKEIVLREDGRTWDLGYTRSVCRPDGKVATIYYFTTEKHPEQHIAFTIWDPDRIPA